VWSTDIQVCGRTFVDTRHYKHGAVLVPTAKLSKGLINLSNSCLQMSVSTSVPKFMAGLSDGFKSDVTLFSLHHLEHSACKAVYFYIFFYLGLFLTAEVFPQPFRFS
jgi:hypothetical protein